MSSTADDAEEAAVRKLMASDDMVRREKVPFGNSIPENKNESAQRVSGQLVDGDLVLWRGFTRRRIACSLYRISPLEEHHSLFDLFDTRRAKTETYRAVVIYFVTSLWPRNYDSLPTTIQKKISLILMRGAINQCASKYQQVLNPNAGVDAIAAGAKPANSLKRSYPQIPDQDFTATPSGPGLHARRAGAHNDSQLDVDSPDIGGHDIDGHHVGSDSTGGVLGIGDLDTNSIEPAPTPIGSVDSSGLVSGPESIDNPATSGPESNSLPQPGARDIGGLEPGPESTGSPQAGAVEIGGPEYGPESTGSPQAGAVDISGPEYGPESTGSPQAGAVDISGPEYGPESTSSPQPGARDIGVSEPGVTQHADSRRQEKRVLDSDSSDESIHSHRDKKKQKIDHEKATESGTHSSGTEPQQRVVDGIRYVRSTMPMFADGWVHSLNGGNVIQADGGKSLYGAKFLHRAIPSLIVNGQEISSGRNVFPYSKSGWVSAPESVMIEEVGYVLVNIYWEAGN